VQGWRVVHLGMLLNGSLAILLGLAFQQLSITAKSAAWVSWGTIIAVWGNLCFYLFGMFSYNHGVTMGTNALGEGNLAGALAFLPAFAGAVTLLIALIIMLRAKIPGQR
jgi:hypothetical protein